MLRKLKLRLLWREEKSGLALESGLVRSARRNYLILGGSELFVSVCVSLFCPLSSVVGERIGLLEDDDDDGDDSDDSE